MATRAAGHQAADALGGRLDRLDPVVDVEDLAAAVQLAADGVAHQPVVVLRDAGLDRESRLGRGLDHGQVTDADQGEVQGARDRRGRQCEDVDLAPHGLDRLLVGDPEALLLVDHEQPEVGEGDVLREDPMRPDEHVDRPIGDALDDPLLLLAGHEAAEHGDPQREGGEAPLECVQVLLRQHRCRHQHRDLLPVLDRLERRAEGDLRLAVPDVADHQAVHRPAAEHVGLDLLDAARLVGRLRVRKALLELALPGRVGREGETRGRLARGVDLDQLARKVPDRAPHARLRALPIGPAQLRQRRRRSAGVARDAPDLLGRQEDLVGAGEIELEVLLHVVAEGPLRHADVARDPVVDMHDVVAGSQLADEIARHDPLPARQAPDARRTEQLAVGQQQQAARLVRQARGERSVHEADAAGRRQLAQLGDGCVRPPRLLEQLTHPAGLVGGDHDATPGRRELVEPCAGSLRATGKRRGGRVAGILPACLVELLRGARGQLLQGAGRVVRRRPGAWDLTRRHEAGVPVGGLLVEVPRHRDELAGVGEDDVRRRRRMVRRRAGGEKRRPRLGRLPEVALREPSRVFLELFRAPSQRVLGYCRPSLRRQELGRRQEVDLRQTSARRLRHRIKAADRLDLVAEQLDPHRLRGSRRPRVDQAAAVRELGDAGDLRDRVVATGHQRGEQAALRNALADTQMGAAGLQLARAQRPLDERQERRDEHEAPHPAHVGEDAQPLGGLVVLGQRALEWQRRALRERSQVPCPDPRGEVIGEPMRLLVRARDDDERNRGADARATRRDVRRSRRCGHTKDARFRQMGPEGVNERCDAAITAA